MTIQTMTNEQFEAAAALARLGIRTHNGECKTLEAARLHFVEGLEPTKAAKAVGIQRGAMTRSLTAVSNVLQRIELFNASAA